MPLENTGTSSLSCKASPCQRIGVHRSLYYSQKRPIACFQTPSLGVCNKQRHFRKSLLLQTEGARQRCFQCLAVASLSAETAVSTSIVLKNCELSFGDTVKVVGESDLFGSWSSDQAPELQWKEGHDWQANLDVPPGGCTFKLVIVSSDGGAQWESGDNRSIRVPADVSGGQVTIMCHFNQTSSTEVQVTPAAAAQPSNTDTQEAAADSPVDDLTDDFAAGDAAVQMPAVQDRAEEVQQQAEGASDNMSPADGPQEQAAAEVQETMTQAAPEEDLEDTISVLQGAESDIKEQQELQASSNDTDRAADSPKTTEAEMPGAQAKAKDAEQSASPPSNGQKNNDQDYSSFTTFGKSRVTDVARDGSITFTFEEDEDDDAQALSSKLLSSS